MNTCLETPSGDNQAAPDAFNDEVIRFSGGETLRVILSDYPFYCNGTVRSWSLKLRVFQTPYDCDCSSLSFQIFALRGEHNYNLTQVSSSEVNEFEGTIYLNILPDQRIEVQAGDVVGLLISSEVEGDSSRSSTEYALIGQQNTSGAIMYQKSGENTGNGILMELRAWPFIAVLLGMCIREMCSYV